MVNANKNIRRMIKMDNLKIINEIVEVESFVVDSDLKAEWALRKIVEESEELNRIETLCNSMIETYKMKIQEATKTFESKTMYFKNQLEDYFLTVKAKETKTQKTYKLGTGTLKMKLGGDDFVKDEEKLLEWAKKNAQKFVKKSESVEWGELKKELKFVDGKGITADGEIVDGLIVKKKQDKFEIELGGI